MKASLRSALLAALLLSSAGTLRAQVIDHSHPSAGNDDLVANQSYDWGPIFMGAICRLTDKGTSEAASVFSNERVNVSRFRTSFEFQIMSGGPGDTTTGEGNCADGLTFTIQNISPKALGDGGGSLGYGGIGHSVAIKFDCVPNAGDPSVSSTGLFANGQAPMGGKDLLQDGISLRSQHAFRVDMEYDGRVLAVQIIDTATGYTATQSYAVDIPHVIGSPVAYVGFTAATGLGSSAQDIHKWYFASPNLRQAGNAGTLGHAARKDTITRVAAQTRNATIAAWPTTSPHVLRVAAAKTNTPVHIASRR